MTEPTAVPDAPVEARSDRATAVFVVTALGAFMASLDLSIVNIAFPAMEKTFSSDPPSAISWVVTGYAIAFGALLVVAGRTADRLGARRVFFTGLAIFCGASALCGIAPTLGFLDAGRVLQGFGAAAMLPSSLGLLLASVPHEKRTVSVARWGGVGALAVATGPTLGALLVTAGGWRWVFYVNLPIGFIAWLAGRRVLPSAGGDASRAAPDYVGALLAFASLGSFVLAITEGETWGWTSAAVIGCIAAAIGLGTWFVVRCTRHPEPVLDLTLFQSRTFTVANVAMTLYAMGFFAMLLGNILFLTHIWGYSILDAGLAVTPGPMLVAIVAGPAGAVASRIGFRRVLLVGAAFLAAGLGYYALRVTAHPDYLAVWLPATLLVGFGIGLSFPVLGATAVSSLSRERFSVGSAVNQTARQVGGSIGVAILVVILGAKPSVGDFRDVWLYGASMAVLSGLVCLLLPGRGRRRGVEGPAVADLPVTTVATTTTEAHDDTAWGQPHERTVTWFDPVVLRDGAPRSGVELLSAIRDGVLPPPPMASLLGLRIVEVSVGRVVFECEPDASTYNPLGVVHGGLVCTLADSVMGCAVHSTLGAEVSYTSIDLSISYLRPVSSTSGTLRATGLATKVGRRVGFASASIVDGAGREVATATSSLLVLA